MATGHIDPGFGDTVSRLRRAKSAYPLGSRKLRTQIEENVDTETLEQIRCRARDAWLRADVEETSYLDHYKDRFTETQGPTKMRPTSPTRINKPHPSLWFLTCRLHHCAGYHNPDATIGKAPYKVDGSAPSNGERAQLRRKYIGRPSTATFLPFKKTEELDIIPDPIERQATEAWLKVANERDKKLVLSVLREEKQQQQEQGVKPTEPAPIVPSLHRWMKTAGYQERDALYRLSATRRHIGPVSLRQDLADKISQSNARKLIVHPQRGEYVMHPEWPPSIPHHRLPYRGLSY